MAKKKYTVQEKERHYSEKLKEQPDVSSELAKVTRQANYNGYASGYLAAVKDCREALLKTKK